MPPDPIDRPEFEGYVRRHEADHFAHAPMRHDLRGELLGDALGTDKRLTALERWQQRIIGGLLFASFITGGGALVVVIELLRKP